MMDALPLVALFALLAAAPAVLAQEDAASIVINEAEISPPDGAPPDSHEWVEVYNPTSSIVDISGWSVSSATTHIKAVVPDRVSIRPGQYFTLTHAGTWFVEISERAVLVDASGNVIDKTALMTDTGSDDGTWGRVYDGLDTDSLSDWKFSDHSRGASNGKQDAAAQQTVTVDVSTDKESYLLGETATITGTVGGIHHETTAFYFPARVTVTIEGPSLMREILIIPDEDLTFSTLVDLDEQFGAVPGRYDVTARYVGSVAASSFVVGDGTAPPEEPEEYDPYVIIWTDRESYVPGQTAVVLAASNAPLDYGGLELEVSSPSGLPVYDGVLYPSGDPLIRTFAPWWAVEGSDPPAGSADVPPRLTDARAARFVTSMFIDTIAPEFGSHSAVARYAGLEASHAFTVDSDAADSSGEAVSLSLDADSYEPGDTVRISGRVNLVWTGSLDVSVDHVQNPLLLTGSGRTVTYFGVTDTVRPDTDGRFSYDLHIPDDRGREGDYLVTVSGDPGHASALFTVGGPARPAGEPLTLELDADEYRLGGQFTASGRVDRPDTGHDSSVIISLEPQDGRHERLLLQGSVDAAGAYRVDGVLDRTLFSVGSYTVEARYISGGDAGLLGDSRAAGTYRVQARLPPALYEASAGMAIIDTRSLGGERFTAELDAESYRLGSTLRLSGVTDASIAAASVDVTLARPDGELTRSSPPIADGRYEWSWKVPTRASYEASPSDGRTQTKTNLGAYTLAVSVGDETKELVFTVGDERLALSRGEPLAILIPDRAYSLGDTLEITGSAVPSGISRTGTPAHERVSLTVLTGDTRPREIVTLFATPDRAGSFDASLVLSGGIYSEGSYLVTAEYAGKKVRKAFAISDAPPVRLAEPPAGAPPPDPMLDLPPAPDEPAPAPSEPPLRITDEHDGITADSATIVVGAREAHGQITVPGSLRGTLTLPDGSGEASLRLTLGERTCVIGPEDGCLVQGSTRTAGGVYADVTADGSDYRIRYSGASDGRAAFTVLPAGALQAIPDTEWTMEAVGAPEGSYMGYRVSYAPAR